MLDNHPQKICDTLAINSVHVVSFMFFLFLFFFRFFFFLSFFHFLHEKTSMVSGDKMGHFVICYWMREGCITHWGGCGALVVVAGTRCSPILGMGDPCLQGPTPHHVDTSWAALWTATTWQTDYLLLGVAWIAINPLPFKILISQCCNISLHSVTISIQPNIWEDASLYIQQ